MRVKCPTCKTEVQWENNPHRPFCSERCRLIDLGAWATEKYKIPPKKQDVDADNDDGDDQTHYN
jgi:hypothetical protein